MLTDLTGAGSWQSTFNAINSRDQIVGGTCQSDNPDALLCVGGKQYDLNTLIAASDDHRTEAVFISDRGQIIALDKQPNRNERLFLLTRKGAICTQARALPTHTQ